MPNKNGFMRLFFISLFILGIIPFAPAQDTISEEEYEGHDSIRFIEVVINEKIVEAFKLSQKNKEGFDELYDISSFDIESLKDSYQKYIDWTASVEQNYFAENADSIPESTDSLLASKSKVIDTDAFGSLMTANPEELLDDKFKNISQEEQVTPNSGLIFRVQIAAGKSSLNIETLKEKYNGGRQIKVFTEEGWFKYYIADCLTMKEAILIKKECGVSDAFIVAYKDGNKVDYSLQYRAIAKSNPTIGPFNNISEMVNDKTIYVVQIAALLSPIPPEEIKKIYTGNENINIINEEGWFKYSIGLFDNRKEANKLRKIIEVKDAFVVGYKNGKKLKPSNLSRITSQTDKNIVFVVQIAASEKILSVERLQQIYQGNEKINAREEKGWYKYSIGSYMSFSEAKNVLNNCGVPGAFIVAYQNQIKMSLYKAIRISKQM